MMYPNRINLNFSWMGPVLIGKDSNPIETITLNFPNVTSQYHIDLKNIGASTIETSLPIECIEKNGTKYVFDNLNIAAKKVHKLVIQPTLANSETSIPRIIFEIPKQLEKGKTYWLRMVSDGKIASAQLIKEYAEYKEDRKLICKELEIPLFPEMISEQTHLQNFIESSGQSLSENIEFLSLEIVGVFNSQVNPSEILNRESIANEVGKLGFNEIKSLAEDIREIKDLYEGRKGYRGHQAIARAIIKIIGREGLHKIMKESILKKYDQTKIPKLILGQIDVISNNFAVRCFELFYPHLL